MGFSQTGELDTMGYRTHLAQDVEQITLNTSQYKYVESLWCVQKPHGTAPQGNLDIMSK